MTDSKSTVPKNKARAQVSSNDVQSTERAAVEAEERAHRAKQALKRAKKEAKKAHKAARRARKAADAASKAFKKAAARAKKAKGRRSHRAGDKKDKKGAGPVATASKIASTKAAPRNADVARQSSPARKETARIAARNTARKSEQRARQTPVAPLPETVDEPDTFVLGETDRPAVD